jgi:tRNA modification GTPase
VVLSHLNYPKDTIAAIATASGISAINVIRVSGPETLGITDKIFRGQSKLKDAPGYTIHYGKIVDPANGELIDEVLISVFKAPHSYTGEDLVEISCHGGNYVAPKILRLLIKLGARLAEPGEFTRRRLLNNKIDLVQAEAVLALTQAHNETAYRSALALLSGKLSKYIGELRESLKEILAELENLLEFEENEERVQCEFLGIKRKLKTIYETLEKKINERKTLNFLNDGIYCAIVGKANVGKSSLFNQLIGENKAIVTSIPGTTRDSIEGSVMLDGLLFHFIDTCGIKMVQPNTPQKQIETLGMKRTEDWINKAHTLILVFDNTRPFSKVDAQLIERLKDRHVLWVINKIDRPQRLDYQKLLQEKYYLVSAKYNQGIENLKKDLVRYYQRKLQNLKGDFLFMPRHLVILEKVLGLISEAINAHYLEPVAYNLQVALKEVGSITEPFEAEEILDRIFSRFCIGK